MSNDMREQYDFSGAERGKFYRPNAEVILPVYLESEVQQWVNARAQAKGVAVNDFVNELLKKDMALVDAVI